MNKLQRFVIIRKHKGGEIDVIGTNSGQAFVEAAAVKYRDRLAKEGGSYQVIEIAKLFDYLRKQVT